MRTLAVNALRMVGRRTAIGRHLEYLAQYWGQMQVPFDRIIFLSPGKPHRENLGSATKIEWRSFGGQYPRIVWEQVLLPRAAKRAAVLFSEYNCPLFYPGRIVVANHGIYEAIPGSFSWWSRMRTTPLNRKSVQRADKVIANSLSTKADLIKYFRVPEPKIDVIYPGPAEFFFEAHSQESVQSEVVKVFGENVPYIIFVGKLSKRRNVPNLMEAFSVARKMQKLPHRLLIVGPNVNDLPLSRLAEQWGIGDVFKYYQHMEQGPLAKLYAGADLFVLPSIYEGISWTMFEAMASGTAVLTVDHPALAEGGGDAVFSLKAPGVEDLVRGMGTLLANVELRKKFEQKGRERVRQFSLYEGARTTMEILDQVALPADLSG
jgi:glycosyltransferase involved in cell wall biosynthesis